MEKIDLVYILGGGSRWNNNEIRYSLRSVENYFLNAGRVFIIGECPEWATNIIHIKVPDKDSNKLLNARAKYLVAAKDKRISDNFALMNDDFFFLKPTKKIDNYSRGTLDQMMKLHPTKNGYYYRSLWDTRKRLDTMGIPNAIDFEIHAPMIFNKEKLLTTISMIETDKAFSIRSCYGNLMNLKPKLTTDFKAANILEFAIQMKRKGANFLSINDALVADENFRHWITNMYPKKSKYETNDDSLKVLPGRAIVYKKYYAKKKSQICSKDFNPGDLIPKEIIDLIKGNPSMNDVWELK